MLVCMYRESYNISFGLRFGLANAIDDYLKLEICVCVANS